MRRRSYWASPIVLGEASFPSCTKCKTVLRGAYVRISLAGETSTFCSTCVPRGPVGGVVSDEPPFVRSDSASTSQTPGGFIFGAVSDSEVPISQPPPGPDENRVTVTSGTRDVVLDGPHDFDGAEFPDGTAVLCAPLEDERAFRAERESHPDSAVVRVAGALWFAKVRAA